MTLHCLGLDSEGQRCCNNGSVLTKLLKDSLGKNKFSDSSKMHVLLVQEGLCAVAAALMGPCVYLLVVMDVPETTAPCHVNTKETCFPTVRWKESFLLQAASFQPLLVLHMYITRESSSRIAA